MFSRTCLGFMFVYIWLFIPSQTKEFSKPAFDLFREYFKKHFQRTPVKHVPVKPLYEFPSFKFTINFPPFPPFPKPPYSINRDHFGPGSSSPSFLSYIPQKYGNGHLPIKPSPQIISTKSNPKTTNLISTLDDSKLESNEKKSKPDITEIPFEEISLNKNKNDNLSKGLVNENFTSPNNPDGPDSLEILLDDFEKEKAIRFKTNSNDGESSESEGVKMSHDTYSNVREDPFKTHVINISQSLSDVKKKTIPPIPSQQMAIRHDHDDIIKPIEIEKASMLLPFETKDIDYQEADIPINLNTSDLSIRNKDDGNPNSIIMNNETVKNPNSPLLHDLENSLKNPTTSNDTVANQNVLPQLREPEMSIYPNDPSTTTQQGSTGTTIYLNTSDPASTGKSVENYTMETTSERTLTNQSVFHPSNEPNNSLNYSTTHPSTTTQQGSTGTTIYLNTSDPASTGKSVENYTMETTSERTLTNQSVFYPSNEPNNSLNYSTTDPSTTTQQGSTGTTVIINTSDPAITTGKSFQNNTMETIRKRSLTNQSLLLPSNETNSFLNYSTTDPTKNVPEGNFIAGATIPAFTSKEGYNHTMETIRNDTTTQTLLHSEIDNKHDVHAPWTSVLLTKEHTDEGSKNGNFYLRESHNGPLSTSEKPASNFTSISENTSPIPNLKDVTYENGNVSPTTIYGSTSQPGPKNVSAMIISNSSFIILDSTTISINSSPFDPFSTPYGNMSTTLIPFNSETTKYFDIPISTQIDNTEIDSDHVFYIHPETNWINSSHESVINVSEISSTQLYTSTNYDYQNGILNASISKLSLLIPTSSSIYPSPDVTDKTLTTANPDILVNPYYNTNTTESLISTAFTIPIEVTSTGLPTLVMETTETSKDTISNKTNLLSPVSKVIKKQNQKKMYDNDGLIIFAKPKKVKQGSDSVDDLFKVLQLHKDSKEPTTKTKLKETLPIK